MTQLPGVNDNKIAAGFYVDAGGNAQEFLYNILTKAFTPVTLPGSFNAMMTTVTDVSDNGIISGFYVDGAGNTTDSSTTAGLSPASTTRKPMATPCFSA